MRSTIGAILFRLISVLIVFFFSPAASAWIMPLDPQNRLHGGLSLTDSNLAQGFTIGLDSRMTRLVFVDVGGFGSISPTPEVDADEIEDPTDLVTLRHGLTVTPGVRIPHRYGEGFNWDLTFRGGFGAIWAEDASSTGPLQVDPALLTGADLLLRHGPLGLRASGRVFGFKTFTKKTKNETPVARPQYAVELVYQW